MTEHNNDYSRPWSVPDLTGKIEAINQKPVLAFTSWATEAVYLAVPMDTGEGVHVDDLALRLGHGERAGREGVSPDDIRAAIAWLVSGAWVVVVDDMVYRTNFERSIVLAHT